MENKCSGRYQKKVVAAINKLKQSKDCAALTAKKGTSTLKELQRIVLDCDKESLTSVGSLKKNDRTIAQQEHIISEYGGIKLGNEYFYAHLSDYFEGDIDYYKTATPCEIIFSKEEQIIPEEYFYSFYLIPTKGLKKENSGFGKEIIVYITSRDGVNVYICSLMNSFLLSDKELIDEFNSELAYYADGITFVYPKDINDATKRNLGKDAHEFYRGQIRTISKQQAAIAEYNEKHHSSVTSTNRTIAMQESVIINKYGGIKVDKDYFYKHISDIFGNRKYIDDFKMLSPCQIIFAETKVLIPEEYFYSFYLIPYNEQKKQTLGYGKEIIAYITSKDGVGVYACGCMNEYVFHSRKIIKDFELAMVYYANGIAVSNEDIKKEKQLSCRGDNESYHKLIETIGNKQQAIKWYNSKYGLPKVNNNCRTIVEQEDVIVNKYCGIKLDNDYFYNHLSDLFGIKEDLTFLKKLSACQLIFLRTNEIIPEEYFYSFYLIPTKELPKRSSEYEKEVIAYVTSKDGVNVYACGCMNEYNLCSKELIKEFHSSMCYYADGIVVSSESFDLKFMNKDKMNRR